MSAARQKVGKKAGKAVKPPKQARSGLYRVRRSKVHGLGAFASKAVRKGTRVAEYLGDRISHQEANRRYDTKDNTDNHTFLFTVDRYLVIDGGSNGNDARFINHSCDPNLEATVEQRRVFLDAVRNIKAGEELSFDYQIGRDKSDPPDIDKVFACRCGAELCRGTMLYPAKRPKPRDQERKAVAKRSIVPQKETKAKKRVKAKRKAARK